MSGNDVIVGDGILGSINNMMTMGLGPHGAVVPVVTIDFRGDMICEAGIVILGPANIPQVLGGLNSEVELGLFRYAELKYDDEMGMALHVSINSEEAQTAVNVEDYALPPDVTEDWNILQADPEDWGFGVLQGDEYDAHLFGTNDGFNVFLEEDLINLIETTTRTRRYSCSNTSGQFFTVRVSAIDYPKIYHLSGLEIAGTTAGRLN